MLICLKVKKRDTYSVHTVPMQIDICHAPVHTTYAAFLFYHLKVGSNYSLTYNLPSSSRVKKKEKKNYTRICKKFWKNIYIYIMSEIFISIGNRLFRSPVAARFFKVNGGFMSRACFSSIHQPQVRTYAILLLNFHQFI